MKITMTAKGLDAAMASIRKASDAALNAGDSPTWLRDVAEFEAKQAAQTWASEGAKSGKKWPALTEGVGNMKAYVAWKRRNHPGKKMNVWRGDTRDSFRHVTNASHIARKRGDLLEFGSKAKLAPKMHDGESHGSWQKAFLKEKSPVFPKGSRKRQNRSSASGRFESGHHMAHKGRRVKGRKWFTFWFKEIPARPLARKSPAQVRELMKAIARGLFVDMSKAAGATTRVGRMLAMRAGQLRADPRL